MFISIQGIRTNIPVTTVILGLDREDPEGYRLKMFHCIDCGNKVVQYKGHAISITPGGAPVSTGTVCMCKICKKRYLFDSVV